MRSGLSLRVWTVPRNAKPRKAHQPTLIGRPVLKRMHEDIIAPAYVALTVLQRSEDVEALESARHSLAACFNYLLSAGRIAGFDVAKVQGGLEAITYLDARFARVKTYRANGLEFAALRSAVVWCDETLPRLRTNHIEAGRRHVHRTLFGITVKESK